MVAALNRIISLTINDTTYVYKSATLVLRILSNRYIIYHNMQILQEVCQKY